MNKALLHQIEAAQYLTQCVPTPTATIHVCITEPIMFPPCCWGTLLLGKYRLPHTKNSRSIWRRVAASRARAAKSTTDELAHVETCAYRSRTRCNAGRRLDPRDDVSSRSGRKNPYRRSPIGGALSRCVWPQKCARHGGAVRPMRCSGSGAANCRHVARKSPVGPAARSKARRRMSNPCRCCRATTSKLPDRRWKCMYLRRCPGLKIHRHARDRSRALMSRPRFT